jgi:hypothetical protein
MDLNSLSPRERQLVQLGAQLGVQNQRAKPPVSVYYSAVRFAWAISGAGPYTYTLTSGEERRAFGYAWGEDLTGANVGYPTGYGTATYAETNLLAKGETNAGQKVSIRGISAYVTADSDPYLAQQTFENVHVSIAMNGDDRNIRLGRLAFIPASGGLAGHGISMIGNGPPPINKPYHVGVGSLSNGMPSVNNYLPLPYQLDWMPKGGADSTLTVRMIAARTVTATGTARAADTANGIQAYAPPSAAGAAGTYVGVILRLHCVVDEARSKIT